MVCIICFQNIFDNLDHHLSGTIGQVLSCSLEVICSMPRSAAFVKALFAMTDAASLLADAAHEPKRHERSTKNSLLLRALSSPIRAPWLEKVFVLTSAWKAADQLCCAQGTNAHAVLTRGPGCAEPQLKPSALWHHHRFWHSPAPHPALHKAVSLSGATQSVTFQTMLSRPELSFLGQHKLLSQRVLAAMAVAEVASAAGAMLKEDALETPVGTFGCVWGTRLIMQGESHLQTTVHRGSGQLVVSCGNRQLMTGILGRAQVCCSCLSEIAICLANCGQYREVCCTIGKHHLLRFAHLHVH